MSVLIRVWTLISTFSFATTSYTLAKVYTKILAKRLAEINKRYNIIRNEQIGFIEGEQTRTRSSDLSDRNMPKKATKRNKHTAKLY